jgi:hypothetical protein
LVHAGMAATAARRSGIRAFLFMRRLPFTSEESAA